MPRHLIFFVIPYFLIIGCEPHHQKSAVTSSTYSTLKHAENFHFESYEDGQYLIVDKPWPNAATTKAYKLDKPLKRVVCTSTSHLPYFELLGEEDAVVGFPNLDYISSSVFRKKVENGELVDLGPDGSMNLELLIGLNPDAVIAFDMGGESTTLDKIEEVGIPVIYNSDFLEKSPLGRAEWIKFFGALLNEEEKADSVFTQIELAYQRLTSLADTSLSKPTILSGVVYGDTWFLPGGQNWSATFFSNAGGEYLWEKDSSSGWLELSFESVYATAHDADYWIGTSTINSKAELLGQDARYADFVSFQTDRIYSYNKRKGPNGGYDFFESGYSRPDLVLADLIKILHPELLPEYETVYFQQLK